MQYFENPHTSTWSRIRAVEGICTFAQRHPQRRGECVQFLTEALSNYAQAAFELNGFLVYYLVQLKATEASEVMAKAFEAGRVNEDMNGFWAAVQVELGLANEADFTPDELLGAGDREIKRSM